MSKNYLSPAVRCGSSWSWWCQCTTSHNELLLQSILWSRDNTVWYSVISQAAAPPLLTFMALDAGCLQLQPRIMGDMCGHVEQSDHHLSSHPSWIISSHQNIKTQNPLFVKIWLDIYHLPPSTMHCIYFCISFNATLQLFSCLSCRIPVLWLIPDFNLWNNESLCQIFAVSNMNM